MIALSVQSAVLCKSTVDTVSLLGFRIPERDPQELSAGGVAVPDCEILVAPTREGRQDGLHGGAAVLGRVVVPEGSEWLQQVDKPLIPNCRPKAETPEGHPHTPPEHPFRMQRCT
jgi:hypothetical protein